jgi:glyoxylase-like metal-dependent hydrolase (beta-lactamase superfamily II)
MPGLEVIHTPGHTPGGVCYFFADFDGAPLLLSGDTLFAGSIGRTDFPGGSMSAMTYSLKKLAFLPDETVVVPGHGPATTIAAEKACNPFLA